MSMAVVAVGLQVVGMAQSATASFYETEMRKIRAGQEALNFDLNSTFNDANARLAGMNAQMMEVSAQTTLLKGQRQEQSIRLKGSMLKGAQRASLAANGVDLGVGNAAEIQAGTDLMIENDALMAKFNAVSEAWGHRVGAANTQAQASMLRANAVMNRSNAAMARAGVDGLSGANAALTSLISSGSQVASSWYRFDQAGAFDGAWGPARV